MEQLDLEKLEKAIIYVERIADGKNPVNNVLAEEDSVLNDPNVIRCMFFVKEALIAVKNNGGVVGKASKPAKKPFPIESLSSYQFIEEKTITRFVEQLNSAVNLKEYEKLSFKAITDWLKANAYLQEINDDLLKKKVTISTEKGNDIGITHSLQTNMSGIAYYRVVYDKKAQEFIINHIIEIINSGDLVPTDDTEE